MFLMIQVVIQLNKFEKETAKAQLSDEEKALNELKSAYKKARKDVKEQISALDARTDMENLQSIVYQKKYQEALLKQIDGALDDLNSGQYKTTQEFFEGSYANGYVGSMYELQKQGIPITVPIDQKKMVTAIKTDSKLSKSYYQNRNYPENISRLKKSIRTEVSRGIASGKTWKEVAWQVAEGMNSPFNRAMNDAIRIIRTEGNRINQQGRLDSGDEAVSRGCDLLKQWDATMDSVTRPWHMEADGQIVEWNDFFTVDGEKMKAPSVGGSARNVCNCRCQLLKRPRWALDEAELEELKKRASFFGLDKSESFEDFKQKYLNLPKNADKIDIKEAYNQPAKLGGLSGYPKTHHQTILNYLDEAPDDCRRAWNAVCDDFHILKINGKGAYYSARYDGVKLSITSARKGSSYQTPYQVVFHEYGHHMDYIFNRIYGDGDKMKAFTETYKGGVFGKTIKEEANKAIEDFAISKGLFSFPNKGTVVVDADKLIKRGLLKNSEKAEYIRNRMATKEIDRIEAERQFCKYIKDNYSLIARSDISDMFEPIMKSTDYPFGVGHGKSYWKNRDNGKEGFAEMFSAKVNNKESWDMIQKYFPESIKMFEEILKVVK